MFLRDSLKYSYYQLFKFLGVNRRSRLKNQDKPLVLTYHGVLPEIPADQPDYEYRNFVTVKQFENQIGFLLKTYKPLKASDFYNGGSNLSGGFLITFDDGFRNNFTYAVPVLQKYGLQAIFFVTTDFIGSREFLWTEQVTRLIQKTNKAVLEVELDKFHSLKLTSILDKENASLIIRKYLKNQPPLKRNKILKQMKSQLNDVELTINREDEERYLFMSWNEVVEMTNSGQMVGSHTHTHSILSTLNEEESLQELKQSKEAIEKHTGRPCLTLSYPNGEKNDYSPMQKKQLKILGYKCAFTQIPPFSNYQTDRYELNRVNISLKMSGVVFEAKIAGIK